MVDAKTNGDNRLFDMSDIQSKILQELEYTDLTEERLSKILKTPVHRELARMEKEGLVKKTEMYGEERWRLV